MGVPKGNSKLIGVAKTFAKLLQEGAIKVNNLDETNKGGIFNTVSVVGGVLSLKSYVVNDETLEIKQIDELTIVKPQGENKVTFTGENVQKSDVMDMMASLMNLAKYAIGTWLPMFLKTLPALLKEYIATGTF